MGFVASAPVFDIRQPALTPPPAVGGSVLFHPRARGSAQK